MHLYVVDDDGHGFDRRWQAFLIIQGALDLCAQLAQPVQALLDLAAAARALICEDELAPLSVEIVGERVPGSQRSRALAGGLARELRDLPRREPAENKGLGAHSEPRLPTRTTCGQKQVLATSMLPIRWYEAPRPKPEADAYFVHGTRHAVLERKHRGQSRIEGGHHREHARIST